MIIIFDIDGTICDSREVEGECFAEAVALVTGTRLSSLDWRQYPEPTSSGIVRQLLRDQSDAHEKEIRIKKEYCCLLSEARLTHPEEFQPVRGVLEFVERLQREGASRVAIATGCFDDEARFKLDCCGIDFDSLPHATSSDTPRRRDIISLAAARAGGNVEEIIYFGDASWDVVASRALSIPMVGVGRRIEELSELGLEHVFRDFRDSELILEAIVTLRGAAY